MWGWRRRENQPISASEASSSHNDNSYTFFSPPETIDSSLRRKDYQWPRLLRTYRDLLIQVALSPGSVSRQNLDASSFMFLALTLLNLFIDTLTGRLSSDILVHWHHHQQVTGALIATNVQFSGLKHLTGNVVG